MQNNYRMKHFLNFVHHSLLSPSAVETQQDSGRSITFYCIFRAVPLFYNPHTFKQRDLVENTEGRNAALFVQKEKVITQ